MNDHLSSLIGDRIVSELLATPADVVAMVAFEKALAAAESELGLIPKDAASQIISALDSFKPDFVALKEGTECDGVVVPEFLRQVRSGLTQECHRHLHFGATSQDAIDTAFALKLMPVFSLFRQRLEEVIAELHGLKQKYGSNRLMGRTRMQAAIAMKVGDRIANWTGPLERLLKELPHIEDSSLRLSLFGAVGTSEKWGDKGALLRNSVAEKLGLKVPDLVSHSQRDNQVRLGNWLAMTTGALGKLGQDIALMGQNERQEITLSGGGGSSAMPHKQNPVLAEVLVTLARFNAAQSGGLQNVMVHEQERSGSAWTLEWMILPLMLEATGTALRHALTLLKSIRSMVQDT